MSTCKCLCSLGICLGQASKWGTESGCGGLDLKASKQEYSELIAEKSIKVIDSVKANSSVMTVSSDNGLDCAIVVVKLACESTSIVLRMRQTRRQGIIWLSPKLTSNATMCA